MPPLIELCGVLHADIGAAAAFHAIPAGEFVDLEQIRIVENQALRVFVGKRADAGFIGPQDELRDRLDRLRAPGLHADERVAVFQAGRRHDAPEIGLPDMDVVGYAG